VSHNSSNPFIHPISQFPKALEGRAGFLPWRHSPLVRRRTRSCCWGPYQIQRSILSVSNSWPLRLPIPGLIVIPHHFTVVDKGNLAIRIQIHSPEVRHRIVRERRLVRREVEAPPAGKVVTCEDEADNSARAAATVDYPTAARTLRGCLPLSTFPFHFLLPLPLQFRCCGRRG
jgi:hypothetical protein